MNTARFRSGPAMALAAAFLFGISMPLSKMLLRDIEPVLLAGLLYLGSGLGLGARVALRCSNRFKREAPLKATDLPALCGAIVAGGMIAPVLLMLGLSKTPASSASLLLNLEGVFTVLLAWFLFRENFDRRILVGLMAIVAGGVMLSWQGQPQPGVPWGFIAVAGACLGWAVDNNLTRKISGADPVQIAALKGLVAGSVIVALGVFTGKQLPAPLLMLLAAMLGLICYGASLTCFIKALRHIGSARTSAYFSTAPFVGAVLSLIVFAEQPSVVFAIAAALMGIGVWLHLTERHSHLHRHMALAHEHLHYHDAHHQHRHSALDPPGEPHSHFHQHEEMIHDHPHYPDMHHRHRHR